MPGLYNTSSWAQLPLQASTVTACANGYSLGLTGHLTYLNPSSDTVHAMFIYHLEDREVVTSFEATTGNRKVQAQIQGQLRLEECCSECPWESLPCYCPNGHLVLDADMAHDLFVLSIGVIPPSAVLNISLQTSRELPTLPSGAARVTLNSTLTPLAPDPRGPAEEGEGLRDDSPTSCFGGVSGSGGNPWALHTDPPPRESANSHPSSLFAALTGPATNSQHYQLSFRLQVQGPCLLAGIESPSHALRADASPFAVSATSVWISLAEDYNCDRTVEIILHPSEPHLPHLSLERGVKNFLQYEMQIKQRKDFIRAIKKSSDPEKQVNFVRRRFHKDIPLTPVLMLNFCPDLMALSSLSTDLPKVTREIIFLLYLNGELSCNIRDALLLAVRSLPARTLLNVAGGACDSKALFPTSRQCSNESLEVACDYIHRSRLGGTANNLLSVLSRVLALPLHRGYPRQLFLITDTAPTCPGKVMELVRQHAKTTRVFGFAVGSNADLRFLERAAKVSRGSVEIVMEGERLQPKLIKSLKKALEPALGDITIDWYMPDTMEALLTPHEIAPLYPGDCLIGYCALYHTASFRGKRSMGQRARGSSFSSVFQSQEDTQTPATCDTSCLNPSTGIDDVGRALQEITQEISLEFSAFSEDADRSGEGFPVSDIRKRIVRSSYVQEQYMLTHCSVSTEPTRTQIPPSISSDPTHAPTYGSTSSESVGSREATFGDCTSPCSATVPQQGQKCVSQSDGMRQPKENTNSNCKASLTHSSEELVRRKALIQATMSGRSFSSPHGELDMLRLRTVLDKVSQNRNSEAEMCTSHGESLADSCNILSPNLDWDMLVDAQYLFSASPAIEGGSAVSGGSSDSVWQCRAVIRGSIGGRSLSWETSISLETLLGSSVEETADCIADERDCDIHHLAARSIIQDNQDMAWRECDIEHGSSCRFRLKAVQTSKSCSQVSSYTCHIPVDPNIQDVLPGHVSVHRGGRSRRGLRSNSGSSCQGDGRCSEILDEMFETAALPASPLSMSSENSLEKQRCQEGQGVNPFGSQKSSDPSLSSRISVGKRRIRSLSGKLAPLKPPCISGDKESCPELGVQDYQALISLQSAEGFFNLSSYFSSIVQISLQRLLRASPYSSHRGSLSPVSEPCQTEQGDILRGGGHTCKGGSQPQVPVTQDASFLPILATSCPEALCHQADSGRGSETDPCDTSPCPSEAGTEQDTDVEGCSWATAVALAWLEHRSAGYFTEWELLAARAEGWLRTQTLPEGLQLPALKGAARQLFLLLRHWDENLNLNMLCYKPGDV